MMPRVDLWTPKWCNKHGQPLGLGTCVAALMQPPCWHSCRQVHVMMNAEWRVCLSRHGSL